MFWGGLSSPRVCVFTPTRSPGPGTSFPMFLKSLKILFFLNRKFRPGIFPNMTKMLVRTKISGYNRKSYWNCLKRGNYKCWFEISDWQKYHGGILIIFLQSGENPFFRCKIMSLSQENKYNGKFRSESMFWCKKTPQNMIFSWKIKQNHWFFMVSLSELPYSKSQQPTCLPRGRWRHRRNLRRVPTTSDQPDRGGDRKWTASPTEIGASPRFWATFFWKVNRTSIDLLEKRSDKKKGQIYNRRVRVRCDADRDPLLDS